MTFSEGLQEFLPGGDVLRGRTKLRRPLGVGEEGILYKDVMPSHHEGHHHLPNWTRIIPRHDVDCTSFCPLACLHRTFHGRRAIALTLLVEALWWRPWATSFGFG